MTNQLLFIDNNNIYYNSTNLNVNNSFINYSNDPNSMHTPYIPSLANIILLSVTLSLIDIATLIGNLLVVIAVLTTRSLSTVTNYFIMSLAVADMLVAVFVLPISIYMVIYRHVWIFGTVVCDLWVSFDVLLCTASILNLCCISLDRYFAITRPLQYSRKRSPKLARCMIAIVWIASIFISCPPIIGWKDPERHKNPHACYLNRLLSYRIYSSMGSFFVPAIVMVFVYTRIFKVINDREKSLLNSTNKNDVRIQRGGGGGAKQNASNGHTLTTPRHHQIANKSSTFPNIRQTSKNYKNATIYENDNETQLNTTPCGSVRIHFANSKSAPSSNQNSNDDNDSYSICSHHRNHSMLSRSDCTAYTKIYSFLNCFKTKKANITIPDTNDQCYYCKRESGFTSISSFRETNGDGKSTLELRKFRNISSNSLNEKNISKYPLTTAIIAKRLSYTATIKHPKTQTQKPTNKTVLLRSTTSDTYFKHCLRPIRMDQIPQIHTPQRAQQQIKNPQNNHSKYQEHIRLIKESKAAKTLGIVVGGFIACWLPFFVYYVIEGIYPEHVSAILFDLLTWLGYFNSVINPFIYAFYSKQFRFAFYRLTFGKFQCFVKLLNNNNVNNKSEYGNNNNTVTNNYRQLPTMTTRK